MSGPLTCHCCFPHSLLPVLTPPPRIPPGAEVIHKECLALVQQMVEGEKETEERKESNKEIKVVVFCGVVKDFLRTGSALLWALSGAHQRTLKNTCGCMFVELFGFVCCDLQSARLKRS